MSFLHSRYSILPLILLFFSLIASSTNCDDVLLHSMKVEIDRSMTELRKDSLVQPFFISIRSNETNLRYHFSTSFGKINKEELNSNVQRVAFPTILVGNYHRAQNISRNKTQFSLPSTNDEHAIRTFIWMNLDNLYKNAVKNYVEKQAWLKQETFTEKELELNDFEKREATILIEDIKPEKYNFEIGKNLTILAGKQLNDIVKKEKLLVENVSTTFSFNRGITRYCDSEGSSYRFSTGDGSLQIRLSGINEKGNSVFSYKNFKFKNLSQLPSDVEIETAVRNVIDDYIVKYHTKSDDEPYMGPVMIVDGLVEETVKHITTNLYTSPKTRYSNGNHFQKLQGARILSKQLSLNIVYGNKARHHTDVKRDIAPIDIEAVIPPDSITLIQNGKLLNMLTTRQPVDGFPHSNGNAKSGSLIQGIITLTGNETYSYEELKQQLVDEARIQGLDFAYVISSDNTVHRKVNVITGEEIPFIASINLGQPMKSMRRVMGVDKDQVSSADGTVSYPKSILIEDAEVIIYKSNILPKKNYVERPL